MDKKIFDLTNPQKSILSVEKMLNIPINNIVGTMYFKNIDIKKLKEAINITIKNNDALRTKLIEENGKTKQYFEQYNFVNICDVKKNKTEFLEFQKEFASKKINIFSDNLCEFIIVLLENEEVAVIGRFHHIICDAWSLGLIIDNIAINYTNIICNKQELATNSYIDFINREKEYLQSDTYRKNREYWIENIEKYNQINMKDSLKNSYVANRLIFTLNKNESNNINEFCKKNKISPYIVFLTAINLYLYQISEQNNFVITTPVLNRLGCEKRIMGMFINMISNFMENSAEKNVQELLKEISLSTIKTFKNSKYPYMEILKEIREKNISNNINYNIVFSFQNMRPNKEYPELVEYKSEWNFIGYQQEELVINTTDINNSGEYFISYDYLIDLFKKEEIEYMHINIKNIIFNIINNKDIKTKDIEIISKEEKKLLDEANSTDYIYDENNTLIDLFKKEVNNNPDNIALIYKDEKVKYKELDEMSDIIANEISNKINENNKICVICDKSPLMISSLIAIMKSGNAYIPIDPKYPEERIKYILEDSNAQILITTKSYKNKYTFENKIILEEIDYNKKINYTNKANKEKLAYIIYTSGTTGKPKGVQIKHKNILNTLIWRKNTYKFNEEDCVLQIPSFAFDSSVEDIFTPLISGSKLVLPRNKELDINILCEEIKINKVNHFLVVPSLYKVLLKEKEEVIEQLRVVTIAGEDFPISLIKEHFKKLPKVRMINEYGPTENSVCSTYYEMNPTDEKVLIGKPINNCKCYVLNKNLKQLPIGYAGELYLSGKGVSEGYLNKKDITTEKFIKNPFEKDGILYKTGDIAKYNFDGNLEFIGRKDGQVKLNGFRIELKEIEKVILENKEILETIVIVQEINNKKNLVAYITSENKEIDIKKIQNYLKEKLPIYMIPKIMRLEKFPLTPNGKIDKKALPILINEKKEYTLPKNKIEQEIVDICKEVLNIENIGTSDDLITDYNVDSLNIITISSRLFEKNINIQTQDFYKYPTIIELAENIIKNNIKKDESKKEIVKPFITESLKDNISLEFNYKNILLTGVTGYLGIHILDVLLKNTKANIYCIVRKKQNKNSVQRFLELLEYYFDSNYFEKYKNRITILTGELSKEKFDLKDSEYEDLETNIDCIINSAAITKHYGKYEKFYQENVLIVKKLIEFSKRNKILLNQISTTTISGNFLVQNNIEKEFTENDLYIGQNYEDNVYLHTKFEAEKIIIEAEKKNEIRANIFRLGNLMGRFSDGRFQRNKLENAYYTRLLALAKVKYLPEHLKEQKLEFSPIDDVSEAIIKLLYIPNLENKIFHIYTNNLIDIKELLKIFLEYNINCKFVKYEEFINFLKENEKSLKYLVSDLNYSTKFDYDSKIKIRNNITNDYLKKVGFVWNKIDEDYLRRFFEKVKLLEDVNEEE